jgi:hypothetical protein
MSEPVANHAILVLGMHRSGTSAATRMMNLLGAELGSRLLEPREDNQQGFWESTDAYEIDERLLHGIGRRWSDIGPFPPGWENSPAAKDALGHIIRLIEREFADKPLWAIKDPRQCRLAPIWLKAMQLSGVKVSILIVVRDPWEVAQSLAKRDRIDEASARQIWIQHLFEALDATQGTPRTLITYDRLLQDWRQCADQIARDGGFAWPTAQEVAEPAINAFIDTGNRHHWVDHKDQSGSFVQQVFAACETIQKDSPLGWSLLDELREQYRLVEQLTLPAVGSLLQRLQNHDQERQQLIEGHRSNLEMFQAHIDKQTLELLANERRVSELQEKSLQMSEQVMNFQDNLARLQMELQAREQQAYALQERVDMLQSELGSLRNATRSRRWLIRQITRPNR